MPAAPPSIAHLRGWAPDCRRDLGSVGLPGWSTLDTMHGSFPSRLLLDPSGHLQSGLSMTASGPVPSLSYARMMLREVLHRRPARLLMLGSGACAIPTSALSRIPLMHVTAVDPKFPMSHVSEEMFAAPDSIEFVHADASSFLSSSREKYDMVLLDAFTEDGLVPSELVSTSASSSIRRLLAPSGSLVWNMSFRRSRRWHWAMSDVLATLDASGIPSEAYVSTRGRLSANALLFSPRPSFASPGWKRTKFAHAFRRPRVRHPLSPFRWPSDRL